MKNIQLFLMMGAIACSKSDSSGGDSGAADDGGGGSGTPGDISGFIGATDPNGDPPPAPTGDLTCVGPALGVETAAAGCVAQRSMQGMVLDFQSDDPVDDATVEIFQTDTTANAPEVVVETDPSGMFTASDVYACQPFTYRVSTDEALDETKVTIEAHDVMTNNGPTVSPSHEMRSVSSVTYQLIPNLLGISPDVSKGIVAGRAYDCGSGYLEGMQVVIHDGDSETTGQVPDGVSAKYFVDEFPARAQAWTSEDGLWILLDVPPGTWTVDGYVSDEAGGYTKVSSTQLNVVAGSINISSLYGGLRDGVKMPEECLSACG